MATVGVTLNHLGSDWTKACKQAVTDLNLLFKKNDIAVVLSLGGGKGPVITVNIDPSIKGNAVHGRTSAETDGANALLKATVGLPETVTISTPNGVRKAGPGVFEIIAAHEFVHALGHSPHTTQLMAQTFYKDSGSTPAKDKLGDGGIKLPPLALASDSIDLLKGIWN